MIKIMLFLLFSFLLPFNAHAEQQPQIAVASSLQFVLADIVALFKQTNGFAPRITYGSSGNFRRQISQGAPFQLFMSADESYIEALNEAGLTEDSGRVYAQGRLAVVVPKNSPVTLTADISFLGEAIKQNELRHFAIANPEHAPYGRAAREILVSLGIWETIQSLLVKGENASQATQFAISGSSQGGIVPYSLAISPAVAAVTRLIQIPQSLHQPVRQRMVLLKGANERAKAFYDFMDREEARIIFKRYGYEVPIILSDDNS